ncbi:MAG: (deoxy)nucleoside triphosphate pyrophosphohydrolase [Arcanobacterium sp.]|nr:(deoxy)nucleoside triphosphate pyrophosphohydrolase [Arcanobacterium sp.]MDY5589198.1 (deoxy)nucleoside triphosphate pyrophosphohydrolase [Arcanobacterium sp.]
MGAPQSIPTIQVVGAAITNDAGEILCAKRGPGRSLAGFWEFPGGKIEPGESPEEALRREISEELNCEITVGAHVSTVRHSYHFGVVELSIYRATLISGTPQRTEHSELRWVQAQDMPRLTWAPADAEPVAALARE